MEPQVPPVTFDYNTWVGMFPYFSSVPSSLGAGYFIQACGLCANTTLNPLFSKGILPLALYLLTSHIAALNSPTPDGQQGSTLVGRINSATEGSVSVQAQWDSSGSPNESYFTQTKWGAQYWTMAAVTRTAVYLGRPTRVLTGLYPGWLIR